MLYAIRVKLDELRIGKEATNKLPYIERLPVIDQLTTDANTLLEETDDTQNLASLLKPLAKPAEDAQAVKDEIADYIKLLNKVKLDLEGERKVRDLLNMV